MPLLLALTHIENEKEITLDDIPENEKWAFVSEEDGIKTFRAKIENSDLFAFLGKGIINAPAESIMTVLRTIEGTELWSPMLINKKTIEDVSDLFAYTYQLHDLPWPLENRHLILKNKLYLSKKDKSLKVIFHSVDSKTYKDAEGIKMHMGFGLIVLRPIDKKRTYLEVKVHLDPKGYLPDWLVNYIQQSWPYNFMKALEKKAKDTPSKVRPKIMELYHKLLKLHKVE